MNNQVLFIQGGGNGGFEEDATLAASLQTELGAAYKVHYPRMPSDETLLDFGWLQQIDHEITVINGEVILVGHSLGASMLLKYLSENQVRKKIIGLFLIATPFWRGDENWVQGLMLKEDFANDLPKSTPIFLYHCRDDEEVSFEHLAVYRQKLPNATIRQIESGGHQLNNDLSMIAKDVKAL
uniref:Alpha/beta hydrolase n=1 Tax=Roseihalotalea indica TaxID=2867963 RepID=A0AA49Q031_9BACT|nr:alpha/beta hydrolase [Tunicatimonas sp. TK19036]